jgi:hypothetical protein
MIRVQFGLLLTDAGVHPAGQVVAVNNPRIHSMTAPASGCCCMVFLYSNLRFNQVWPELLKFWSGYISHDTSYTTVTITIIYRNYTKHFDLFRSAGRSWTSLTLVAPNRRSSWIHYVYLTPVTLLEIVRCSFFSPTHWFTPCPLLTVTEPLRSWSLCEQPLWREDDSSLMTMLGLLKCTYRTYSHVIDNSYLLLIRSSWRQAPWARDQLHLVLLI